MASEEENQGQHIVECDLCQEPVSFFCRRCGANLCDHCLPIHVRIKSKNGHDVVDYVSKDDDDTFFCGSHPKNECSAYCKSCNVPICILCVSIKHKSHEMSELSDKIEELLKVIAKENERLQSYKHDLETILDHTTKMLSSISSFYIQKKDEITARGEVWHKEIDNTVKKLHQELDNMQKEHEALLKRQEMEYVEILKNLDQINRKATSLQKSHDVNEMQTFIPLIEKQKTPTDFTQYSFPTFYESKIDANYLQTRFGYIDKIQEKKMLLSENRLFKEKLCFGKKIIEAPKVVSVIYSGFPIRKENKACMFDMAVSDDSKVWILGESLELKLFDRQGNLQRTVSSNCFGFYLCMYKKQVVFSDYKSSAVKKISNNDTVVTMFTTGDWVPRGITSTAAGDLLLCLRKNDHFKVIRYSSTGTVLQEIQYDSLCQPLYTDPHNITENSNEDIIVSDWGKNAVIAVDRLGIFRYTYSEKDSDFVVCSVAHDSLGHVIVTDFKGDKIHMLDIDGRFLRYIIPDEGVKRPRAVCILGNDEMIVGECLTGIAKIIKY